MKKVLKALVCSLFTLGFILIAGSYVLKADEGTLTADLNNDGVVDIMDAVEYFRIEDEIAEAAKGGTN